jgi:hypothetical protein
MDQLIVMVMNQHITPGKNIATWEPAIDQLTVIVINQHITPGKKILPRGSQLRISWLLWL